MIRRGGTQCNFWKFEPVGENVRIQDAQSGGYLYVPIHNSKHNNNGSNVGTTGTKDEKSLWRFEDCGFTRNKRDIQQLESKVREKSSGAQQTSALSEKSQRDVYLLRKPLAIDSSNQPEIAASSSARSSSWINDLVSWVKSSVGGLLSSALPKETSGTPSTISQVDAPMDVNGTIMLLDVLVRKVTGQKYISTVDQSISPLEAQGYTLNITKGFEKVVEQAALKSGISMHRLNIDYMGMQKEITRKVMSGKFNE
ncbi:MAG: latrotoxin-related protein, partial [Wolbachia sp.]